MQLRLKISLVWMAGALALTACGGKESPTAATEPGTAPAADAAASGVAPANASWTPEALEELLAPVALFPDVVLGHVLTASTNPQEVLDAGNWLIENQDLPGDQLNDGATSLGLSPSVRALVQFPEVMDMMCMQMDWTTELGQAFTADQGAVLDAVQRLRAQAKDVGNLASSPQLKVETETQEGKEIITVEPPSPEIVYVPKYDPAAVYAPPPATIPPPSTINVTPAAGTTTTVTSSGETTTIASTATTPTVEEKKGHSTGALVTTGLLAFGAGLLVNEVFDDDDDWDDYHPNYYGGGMYYGGRPYYPPPPYMYRPPYGNGYYPGHSYNRPPNYQNGFNNNTIIVNNGGNDYWKRQSNSSTSVRAREAKSPITAAKPKRDDLGDLNRQASNRDQTRQSRQPEERREVASRDSKPAAARPSGYAGARPENQAARDRMVAKSPPAGVAKDLPQRPKTEYKGAKDRPDAASRPATAGRTASASKPATRDVAQQRPAASAKPQSRDVAQQRPAAAADRGRDRPDTRDKPASQPKAAPTRDNKPASQAKAAPTRDKPAAQSKAAPARGGQPTAFGGGGSAQSGKADRQASQRGHSSMGGGGGKKPRKPKH
jgi:hypothetical protein